MALVAGDVIGRDQKAAEVDQRHRREQIGARTLIDGLLLERPRVAGGGVLRAWV